MNTQGYEAVIFDMDGLMVDSEPTYCMVWQQTAAALGYIISDELYLQLVGRKTDESEALLSELMGPGFPLAECQRAWPERWRQHVLAEGVPLKPGLLELLEFLEGRGIARAVASSNDREKVVLSLGSLAGRFSTLITGDDARLGKPAPDLFLRAAEELGVSPARCIVLEDSEAGVRAGAAAGMRAVMVPDMKQPDADVRALAYRVCGSLGEAHALLEALLTEGS